MKPEQFNQIIEELHKHERDTLITKADEYARDDRLSNFKRISHLAHSTDERACLMLTAKHIVALFDFANDLENNVHQPADRWLEKIGDIRAYMLLLYAILKEHDRV